MSVRLMTAVWQLELPGTEKLVLLALADWSNDEGHCWPSMQQLAAKSGLTDRALRAIVKRLVDKGHLKRDERPGKGVNYTVNPGSKFRAEEPAPRKETPETPERRSSNTSGTVIEEWVEAGAVLSSPEWKAFCAMRRQIKRPVNPTSQKRLLIKLKQLADDGHPPGPVLEQSTENCWRGVFPITEEENHERPRARNGVGRHKSDPDGLGVTARAAVSVFGPPVERSASGPEARWSG